MQTPRASPRSRTCCIALNKATFFGPMSSAGTPSRIPTECRSFTWPFITNRVSCRFKQWSAPIGSTMQPNPRPTFNRGSCNGISSPLTFIANSTAPLPIFLAAVAVPSASKSPIPSRLAINSSSFNIASTLPNLTSSPPVSFRVNRPFSKHSIAKAIAPPAEIVSSA